MKKVYEWTTAVQGNVNGTMFIGRLEETFYVLESGLRMVVMKYITNDNQLFLKEVR